MGLGLGPRLWIGVWGLGLGLGFRVWGWDRGVVFGLGGGLGFRVLGSAAGLTLGASIHVVLFSGGAASGSDV